MTGLDPVLSLQPCSYTRTESEATDLGYPPKKKFNKVSKEDYNLPSFEEVINSIIQQKPPMVDLSKDNQVKSVYRFIYYSRSTTGNNEIKHRTYYSKSDLTLAETQSGELGLSEEYKEELEKAELKLTKKKIVEIAKIAKDSKDQKVAEIAKTQLAEIVKIAQSGGSTKAQDEILKEIPKKLDDWQDWQDWDVKVTEFYSIRYSKYDDKGLPEIKLVQADIKNVFSKSINKTGAEIAARIKEIRLPNRSISHQESSTYDKPILEQISTFFSIVFEDFYGMFGAYDNN